MAYNAISLKGVFLQKKYLPSKEVFKTISLIATVDFVKI